MRKSKKIVLHKNCAYNFANFKYILISSYKLKNYNCRVLIIPLTNYETTIKSHNTLINIKDFVWILRESLNSSMTYLILLIAAGKSSQFLLKKV